MPEIPKSEAIRTASFTDIRACGNGRPAVLSISLSRSFSMIWLKPLEEPVTKIPAMISKISLEKSKLPAGTANRYPTTEEKMTREMSLSLINSA